MSSWMIVCLQLVERKLQLSGRDKSNAALVYIVPYWVHITASPSQHTLLYQVWSKIKPFESYLIYVLLSAELLLGLRNIIQGLFLEELKKFHSPLPWFPLFQTLQSLASLLTQSQQVKGHLEILYLIRTFSIWSGQSTSLSHWLLFRFTT